MISFKERVKNVAIREAPSYKTNLVEYDFLIYSYCFEFEVYYSIGCMEENYLHLVGVNSNLSPLDFFDKCINKTLSEADFNFLKHGISEPVLKGSVRRKIQILHNMNNIFNENE